MPALLKKLLLAATALALALLLAEGVLHAWRGPVVLTNFTPVPDNIRLLTPWKVPYVLRPGGVGVHEFGTDPRGAFEPGARMTYTINKLGLRGRETTRQKPAGTFRIAGLGDSFTFGTGVRAEDTFLAVAERELGGSPIEVLNFGVMGYSTRHEVELLDKHALSFEPDLVVMCMFLNDAGGGMHQHFEGAVIEAARSLRLRSHLLHGVLSRVERGDAQRSASEAYRASFGPGEEWDKVERALKRATKLCEDAGIPFVLAIFPVLFELSDYPLADVHERIAAHARSVGIPVVDLAPAFAEHDGPELWIHPSNQHPNEEGHRIAGEALTRFLVDEGFVPGPD